MQALLLAALLGFPRGPLGPAWAPPAAPRHPRAKIHLCDGPNRPPGPGSPAEGRLLDRFLLQRALQTQISMLKELHDWASARWLAAFMGHAGIDSYHGFDALRVEPAAYIDALLGSGPTTVQVRVTWGNRHWGGSPGNPHLADRRERLEDLVIYPDRIGASLLRTRDQLADEIARDLDLIAHEDSRLWLRHRAALLDGAGADGQGDGGRRSLPAMDLSSLGDSSPTRRATFDLLQKLTLQVALRRTLKAMAADGSAPGAAEREWLEEVFVGAGFLHGDQGFGAAEAFLDGLIAKPIKVVKADGGRGTLIDPHGIANQILDCRQLVARAYKQRLATARAESAAHLRRRLERSLGGGDAAPGSAPGKASGGGS